MRVLFLLMLLLLLAASPMDPTSRAPRPVVSLFGEGLPVVALPESVRADREAKLVSARRAFENSSTDADSIIWYGRRLAYLGYYHEAIDVYTQGIEQHPDDARLWRHRGHRYITTRQFDAAIEDLAQAAVLEKGEPNEVEPDGLPNARNIPTSTLQSNIWYHLGLAYFVTGRLDEALAAYSNCLAVSKNPDMLVATSYWLYLTLRLRGQDADAQRVLERIHPDMDIIENEGYHRLLLLFKGELQEDQVLGEGDALTSATVGYGIALWHRLSGRLDRAREVAGEVLAGTQWAAFGFIAAEADRFHGR